MKTLISLFAIFYSLSLWAAPANLDPGTYSFKGFSVQQKKRTEVVPTMGSAGQARLKELKSEGYTCAVAGGNFHKCSRSESLTNTESEIAGKVLEKMDGQVLEIGSAQGDPVLVTEGDMLKEWQLLQTARFQGQTYPHLRFLETMEMNKIFLGFPAEASFVMISNSRRLIHPLILKTNESRWVTVTYITFCEFEK